VINAIKNLGIHEMFPNKFAQNLVFGAVCKLSPKLCELAVSLVADGDTSPLNHK